ncbi:Na(+)/H(+) antiporter subunit E [Myxococcaceae bacterium]|jgi:multicomponent Na+:H+ antiporter subunit E|nr:Na(+)/H(+) antiporter subunit E [Myxococcaceae bacterium]
MNLIVLNLFLALVWAGLIGDVTVGSLIVGYVVAYFALSLVHPGAGRRAPFRRVPSIVGLALFFLWELLLSSLRVAWDVLTPRLRARPALLAVPLDAETDLEITSFANLVTLTPGTLSLDVAEDRSVLYVHAMFVDDPAEEIRLLKDGFERRVVEILR